MSDLAVTTTASVNGPDAARPLLECRDLDVGYGKLTVARDISFSLPPKTVLTILGPNGAGKTTLLMTLAGFLPPRAGSITLSGQPVKGASPRRMNRAGLVLIPDFRALFTQLTPVQNLKLAAARGVDIDSVLALFPALQRRAKLRVGDLSGGEQQMLAIARALVQSPKLLLIDEMSMGLAPVVVESLMPIIRSVADEHGASVIMVEQHIQLALEVADEAMVLVHGSVALSGRGRRIPHRHQRGRSGLFERVYRDDLTRRSHGPGQLCCIDWLPESAGDWRLGRRPARQVLHLEDDDVGEHGVAVLGILVTDRLCTLVNKPH